MIVCRFCVVLLAFLGACTESDRSGQLDITARLSPQDSLFGAVEVRGLPRAALRDPDSTLLRVQVSPPGDTTGDLPPLVGRYVVEDGVLRFLPRFRPAGGLLLRVQLRGDSLIRRAFTVPEEGKVEPAVRITNVYPSADSIPANQLRWYLEFSGSMREGDAEQHVHLLDSRGQEVADAFLIVSEELWDPARRRLTLLFDPGRVKRGVRQNLESGAPLVPGRDYTLRIDSAWRDGRGAPLVLGYEKRFHVIEPVRSRLDTSLWKLHAPGIGTREPVTIDFGRALDRALAERLIMIEAGQGSVVGDVRLSKGEQVWQLVPDQRWADREYQVRVSPLLEDPAGNRVGHTFDRDRTAGEWQQGEEGQPVTLRFRPVLYSSARAR